MKNLGGNGNGCNDNSEAFSMRRRHLHHAMFYGFMLSFAATCAGFVFHTFLGWHAPYSLLSLPVILGTAGGILMTVGTVGLFVMKLTDDPLPNARRLLAGDVAMLLLLALVAVTGLLLLAVLPYSKMVHGVYRTAALLRRAAERNMKPLGGE